MRTERNEDNDGILEGFIPAILLKVPTTFPLELKNDKKTPYALANAEVTYPDGSKEVAQTRVYKGFADLITMNDGMEIELRVQLEGKYAGRSVMQLPQAKGVDLAKFGIKIDAGQPAVAV